MKHLFFAFSLFFALKSSGQLTLEHTYNGEAYRVNLEKSGEKYYQFDQVNQRVDLYNKDHSFWQQIPFPYDASGKIIRVFEVSETKIIPDKEIELVYLYDGGVDGLFLRIMNEHGVVYFDQNFVSTFELSVFPGQPTKLITTNALVWTQIFALPSFIPEKLFNGYDAKRIMLDNGDIKYFYADTNLHIFNADYSLYKQVSIPSWFKGGPNTVEHASQLKINSDGLLEIIIRNSTGQVIVISENGNELKRSTTGFLSMSVFPGHADKLILNDTVFSLPGLTVDHIYSKFSPFRVLAESGPKYLMGLGDSIRGYDASHNLFFNLRIPHSFNFYLSNLFNCSEKIFNSDNKLELLYRVVNLSTDSARAEGKICNQDQTLLFNEVDLNFFTVSQLGGGLQNKLLAYISNWSEPVYETKVYGLPSYDYTTTKEIILEKAELDICPNPANARFMLCGATDQLYTVTMFDISGTELRTQELSRNQEFNLLGIPKGIYVVTIDDHLAHRTIRKLVVN